MTDTLARMRQLIGTTAEWASNDLVLGLGEIGCEVAASNDRRFKIGDGVRTFSALPYSTVTQAQLDGVSTSLSAETAARIAADDAEATARAAADNNEIAARTAADNAEAATRAAADTAETNARIAGDAAEASTRAAADSALDARLDVIEGSTTDFDTRIDAAELELDLARKELLTEPAVSELASMWSAAIIGEPSTRAGIANSEIVLTSIDGLAIRVTGAAVRAPRAAYRMLPGHLYEVVAFVRRETNPSDPSGDTVQFRGQWLDNAKSSNGTATFAALTLTTAMGFQSFRTIVSLSTDPNANFVAPAATVYFTPYVQTYGTNGVTNIIPFIRVTDLTSNTLLSADVSGLNARVTALESLNAGARLTALESATASPNTAWFETVAAATAATIGATANKVIVLGTLKDPDLLIQYVRVVSGQDFTSADGAKWGIDHSTQGVIAKNITYTVAPSGGDFTEPGAATDFLRTRRIKPGVTVTISIANGTYNCTRRIRGMIDGRQVVWTTSGIIGSPWVGTDFDFLNTYWLQTHNVTGLPPASLAAAKAALEPVVRAKYRVILQFAGTGDAGRCAMAACGMSTGDWTLAPCLFIATGTVDIGCHTGAGINNGDADGDGGWCEVNNVAFFGFGSNHATHYGGTINANGALSAFGTAYNMATHFAGCIYANGAFLIGNANYGARLNHGGSMYFETDAVWVRGCGTGFVAHNSAGMIWGHYSDLQYCWIGDAIQWGGSIKIQFAKVKNNSRTNHSVSVGGSLDATSCDSASTISFPGSPAGTTLQGILIDGGGCVDFTSGTNTGSQTDTTILGDGVIRAGGGATFGPKNYTNSGEAGVTGVLTQDPFTGHFTVPPQGIPMRPRNAIVQIAAGVVTLPYPVPKTIGIVQPAGLAGTPIAMTNFDIGWTTLLPKGEKFVIWAPNALTGEKLTLAESGNVALGAPSRYLSHPNDVLEFVRSIDTNTLSELSYRRNGLNASSDVKRPYVHSVAGGLAVDRDFDVVIVNKTTGAATAITMDANMNYVGSELIVKDGKRDAATNPITVTPGGGRPVEGVANYVINTNGGYVRMIYDTSAFWQVIGKG